MSTQLVWHQCCPGNSSWLHRVELGIDQSRGPGASAGLEAIRLLQFTDGGVGWTCVVSSAQRAENPSGTNLHTTTVQYLQQSIMEIWCPLCHQCDRSFSFSLEHLESSRPIHRRHGFPMEEGYLTLCNHNFKWGSSYKEQLYSNSLSKSPLFNGALFVYRVAKLRRYQ